MKRIIKVIATYDLNDPELTNCKISPKEKVKDMVTKEMIDVFGWDEGYESVEVEVSDMDSVQNNDYIKGLDKTSKKALEEFINEEDYVEDVMIRASRKANFSPKKVIEIFINKGILEIYNLGMKHMYEYLCPKNDKLIDNEKSEIWSWNETYSDDWTHGIFSSREEAIEDALATKKAWNITDKLMGTIHVGKCEYVPIPTSVDSEDILNDLSEQHCSETGCEDYIYDGVSDEDIKWLEDKLSELMCEFHQRIKLQPSWFVVVEKEEVDLSDYE